MEFDTDKADRIFEEVNQKFMPTHKGKIVAIETDSGDYAIGDNEVQAYDVAAKKHPNKKFVFKRIGSDYTYFIGAVA